MQRVGILAALAAALLVGCAAEPDDCGEYSGENAPYIGEPMFDRCSGLELAVDRAAYALGDTLVLTASFETLYSGIGSFGVQFLPLESWTGELGVVVVSPPFADVDHIAFSGDVDLAEAGQCQVAISFVVRDNTPYHISATVRFRQVYDPVGEQLLLMGSDEQIEALGRLDHTAFGNSVPLTLPRPQPK